MIEHHLIAAHISKRQPCTITVKTRRRHGQPLTADIGIQAIGVDSQTPIIVDRSHVVFGFDIDMFDGACNDAELESHLSSRVCRDGLGKLDLEVKLVKTGKDLITHSYSGLSTIGQPFANRELGMMMDALGARDVDIWSNKLMNIVQTNDCTVYRGQALQTTVSGISSDKLEGFTFHSVLNNWKSHRSVFIRYFRILLDQKHLKLLSNYSDSPVHQASVMHLTLSIGIVGYLIQDTCPWPDHFKAKDQFNEGEFINQMACAYDIMSRGAKYLQDFDSMELSARYMQAIDINNQATGLGCDIIIEIIGWLIEMTMIAENEKVKDELVGQKMEELKMKYSQKSTEKEFQKTDFWYGQNANTYYRMLIAEVVNAKQMPVAMRMNRAYKTNRMDHSSDSQVVSKRSEIPIKSPVAMYSNMSFYNGINCVNLHFPAYKFHDWSFVIEEDLFSSLFSDLNEEFSRIAIVDTGHPHPQSILLLSQYLASPYIQTGIDGSILIACRCTKACCCVRLWPADLHTHTVKMLFEKMFHVDHAKSDDKSKIACVTSYMKYVVILSKDNNMSQSRLSLRTSKDTNLLTTIESDRILLENTSAVITAQSTAAFIKTKGMPTVMLLSNTGILLISVRHQKLHQTHTYMSSMSVRHLSKMRATLSKDKLVIMPRKDGMDVIVCAKQCATLWSIKV